MKPTHTDEILAALATVRMPAQPGEYDIHAAVARALAAGGVSARHEARLGPRCRVDFLCGKIAIEVKKGRPDGARLARQIGRYLAFDEVAEIIVVTQGRVKLPGKVNGKPVHWVCLNQNWGVALP